MKDGIFQDTKIIGKLYKINSGQIYKKNIK